MALAFETGNKAQNNRKGAKNKALFEIVVGLTR